MLRQTLITFALYTLITFTSAQPQTYVYKTIDNLNLTLDVYLPTASPYSKYPLVFCVHGGGFVLGAKSQCFSDLEQTEVLALGFMSVSMDYRLSPGALMSDIIQDVQDAYTWVHSELSKTVPVDMDNVISFGRSAGGGLAVMCGYMLNPRPKVVVAFYPFCTNCLDVFVYNPNTPVTPALAIEADQLRSPIIAEFISYGGDPRSDLFFDALYAGKAGWLLATANPDEPIDNVISILKSYSVVNNMDKNYPPTYLVHGLNDTMVQYSQSVEMAQVLAATGVKYVLDLVPGVNHGFDGYVTNYTDPIWQQYIAPIFEFMKDIVDQGA